MTLWQRLFGPCAFGHGDPIRSRDAKTGQLQLTCLRCQEPFTTVLASEVTRNLTEGPAVVEGQATGQAKRQVKDNVAEFRKGER